MAVTMRSLTQNQYSAQMTYKPKFYLPIVFHLLLICYYYLLFAIFYLPVTIRHLLFVVYYFLFSYYLPLAFCCLLAVICYCQGRKQRWYLILKDIQSTWLTWMRSSIHRWWWGSVCNNPGTFSLQGWKYELWSYQHQTQHQCRQWSSCHPYLRWLLKDWSTSCLPHQLLLHMNITRRRGSLSISSAIISLQTKSLKTS